VNASEIGNYVFCGIEWHAAHSEQVAGAERSGRLARVFAFALLFILLALAFRFFAS